MYSAGIKHMVLLSILALLFSGTWVMAQSRAGNPTIGKNVYQQHCVRCHGTALDGNGPEGKYLIVKPANLQSIESRTKSDWELLIAISNGVLFTPMHGWRGQLTDQEMLDVIAYIRMMVPSGVIS